MFEPNGPIDLDRLKDVLCEWCRDNNGIQERKI